MQRTDEWHRARRGKLTASNMAQALGLAPWGSPAALAKTLQNDLARQEDPDSPPAKKLKSSTESTATTATKAPKVNPALSYGTGCEPNAILEYEIVTGQSVEATGFWPMDHVYWIGASPDGLVGDDGLVEAKCPFNKKLYAQFPLHYYCQVNAQLQVTGRQWCDLIAWTPTGSRIWRVKANKEAWETLLSHYTHFYAKMARGEVPPNPSKEVRPLIEAWIETDVFHLAPIEGDDRGDSVLDGKVG